MVKETKTIEETEIITKQRFCDDCGKEIQPQRYSSSVCMLCGKDLCNECIGQYTDSGDYPDVYCKSCWSIGEPYRNKITELETLIEKLDDEWKNKIIPFKNKQQ